MQTLGPAGAIICPASGGGADRLKLEQSLNTKHPAGKVRSRSQPVPCTVTTVICDGVPRRSGRTDQPTPLSM